MYRYKKKQRAYDEYQRTHSGEECIFCSAKADGRVLEETEHAYIVRNAFAYDLWEYRDVLDHRMVIPKRHIASLEELNDAERLDIMHILARYENTGYDIFARALNSTSRTVVAHQHTHLIKTTQTPAKFALYLDKPYTLIKR